MNLKRVFCCVSVLEHPHRASRLMYAYLGGVLVMINAQTFLEFFEALKKYSFQRGFIHDLGLYDFNYDPNLAVDVETASSLKFMA